MLTRCSRRLSPHICATSSEVEHRPLKAGARGALPRWRRRTMPTSLMHPTAADRGGHASCVLCRPLRSAFFHTRMKVFALDMEPLGKGWATNRWRK